MSSTISIYWRGKPTFASFLGYYVSYTLPITVLVLTIILLQTLPPGMKAALIQLAEYFKWMFPGTSGYEFLVLSLSWALTLILGLALWVVKISLRPLIFYVAVLTVPELARGLGLLSLSDFYSRVVLYLVACIVAFIGVEFYRRSYEYYITNHTIVLRGGLISKTERSVLLSKIEDVVVLKPLLGRITGFGHIIPVTASQIGLGETGSIVLAETKIPKTPVSTSVGGFRTIFDFKPRPHNSLYGIKNSERIRETILGLAVMGEEYLRRTALGIERIEKLLQEKRENSAKR